MTTAYEWQEQERKRKRKRCHHEWESGLWGVIIGVSKCTKCGAVSRADDFHRDDTLASIPAPTARHRP